MEGTPALRVVVGEDQPLVRAGVVRVLEEDGFEVVAVAGDAPDLLRKTRAHKPDVVVTDIQMPPDSTDDGLRAAMEIRTRHSRSAPITRRWACSCSRSTSSSASR